MPATTTFQSDPCSGLQRCRLPLETSAPSLPVDDQESVETKRQRLQNQLERARNLYLMGDEEQAECSNETVIPTEIHSINDRFDLGDALV